ncbi:MAG: hypothetical protein ACK4KW_09685 [Gemmobacter sp.]
MIGCILWSDRDQRRAVIWCEDQGHLAWLGNPDDFLLSGPAAESWPEVGSLVRLECEQRGSLRVARAVRLMEAEAARDLPAMLLRAVAAETRTAPRSPAPPIVAIPPQVEYLLRDRPDVEARPEQVTLSHRQRQHRAR